MIVFILFHLNWIMLVMVGSTNLPVFAREVVLWQFRDGQIY